jgi:dCMP deaminase
MLKLDEQFRDDYFKFYGNVSPYSAIAAARENMEKKPGYAVVNAVNVVKTSDTLGQTYMECCMELSKKNNFILDEDASRNIFDLVFVYLHASKHSEIESYLGIRFTIRDIYSEMAQAAYGKSDAETIEKLKSIKTEHTYSIEVPRPVSRDRWFYDLAVSVGSYSLCHSRKIGAVLVKDKSVVSTGYNGPPRGVPTCDQRWYIDEEFRSKYGHHLNNLKSDAEVKGVCPRRIIGFPSGQGLEVCPAGHAERNALINAARLGIKTNKTKLYMTCGVPCTPCMVEIINSGVEEIICSSMHIYDETAMYLLENSDLKVRLFDFLV